MAAPTYDLVRDFAGPDADPKTVVNVSTSPHWCLCVVRLGLPLSYSRREKKSITNDVSQSAKLRGPNLIIASDCVSLTVNGSKENHIKALSAELKNTDHNYLVEILPGDWVLAWMVNDETTFQNLLERIKKADPSDPCNQVGDGLKFIGRVDSVRKAVHLERSSGTKSAGISITAGGFRELDYSFYFEMSLGDQSLASGSLGDWLARLNIDADALFAIDQKTGQKNNCGQMITALLDLIVGRGLGNRVNDIARSGQAGAANLQQFTGSGAGANGEAPYAFLVPSAVGALLGMTDASKPSQMLSYADTLTMVLGIQKYSGTTIPQRPELAFVPDNSADSTINRIQTNDPLLGTFHPAVPDFANRPLWALLSQYLNPAINEMYTCLRINPQGRVVPTLVVRQLPFTTEAFPAADNAVDGGSFGPQGESITVTRFLDLPRWKMHDVLLNAYDIGRSDQSRVNFVHIYGQETSEVYGGPTTAQQLVQNPPIRDDLDIMRSGFRPYMMTVPCATQDSVGQAPGVWMALAADHLIGSQYTLNGTVQCLGISAPICEGDNLEMDNTVFHIQSISHRCGISPDGTKNFQTTMTLINGMRANGNSDGADGEHPIYPGFQNWDNTTYDPGLSMADRYDRTPLQLKQGDLATTASHAAVANDSSVSVLDAIDPILDAEQTYGPEEAPSSFYFGPKNFPESD